MAKFVQIGADGSTGGAVQGDGEKETREFLWECVAQIGDWRDTRARLMEAHMEFAIQSAGKAGLKGFRIVPGEDLVDFLAGLDPTDDGNRVFEAFSFEGMEGTYWTELYFTEFYDGSGEPSYGYRGILVKLENGIRYVHTGDGWANPLVDENGGLTDWQASFCTEDNPPEAKYIIGCCKEAGSIPDQEMRRMLEEYKPVFNMARETGRITDLWAYLGRAFLIPQDLSIIGVALSSEDGTWYAYQCLRDMDDGDGGHIMFAERAAVIGDADAARDFIRLHFDHFTPGGVSLCIPLPGGTVISKYIPEDELENKAACRCEEELASCSTEEKESFAAFMERLMGVVYGDGSGKEE